MWFELGQIIPKVSESIFVTAVSYLIIYLVFESHKKILY